MISENSMRQKYTKIHVFRASIRPLARKYTKIHVLIRPFFFSIFSFRLPPCNFVDLGQPCRVFSYVVGSACVYFHVLSCAGSQQSVYFRVFSSIFLRHSTPRSVYFRVFSCIFLCHGTQWPVYFRVFSCIFVYFPALWHPVIRVLSCIFVYFRVFSCATAPSGPCTFVYFRVFSCIFLHHGTQ